MNPDATYTKEHDCAVRSLRCIVGGVDRVVTGTACLVPLISYNGNERHCAITKWSRVAKTENVLQ